MDKTGAIAEEQRNGKTYIDVPRLREDAPGRGQLLAELMRIKAEGDYDAIKALVDKYGVHFDPSCAIRWWRATVSSTYPLTGAGINPQLSAEFAPGGAIAKVTRLIREITRASNWATHLKSTAAHIRGPCRHGCYNSQRMAARLDPAPRAPSPHLVDLRHLRSQDLAPLLDEEVDTWRDLLDWDFGKSADLVRRFVDLRSLNGSPWSKGARLSGYAYYVVEEHKGLIGDLFLRRTSGTWKRKPAARVRSGIVDRRRSPHAHRVPTDDGRFRRPPAHAALFERIRAQLHDARPGATTLGPAGGTPGRGARVLQ